MQLINNILDISKMESGEKIKLRPEEIDFKLLIESVATVFESIMKQKGLTFITDIDENLPPIYADKDRINQILMNLLSNAAKFTEKGSISIYAKLSDKGIETGEIPSFAEVCVEDTGIGIRKEDIINIFDKFTRQLHKNCRKTVIKSL